MEDESVDYARFFHHELVVWNEAYVVIVTILTKFMMAKMRITMMTIGGEGDEEPNDDVMMIIDDEDDV